MQPHPQPARDRRINPPLKKGEVKGGPGGILGSKQYYALRSNMDRADHVGGIIIERSLIHGCGINDDMVLREIE